MTRLSMLGRLFSLLLFATQTMAESMVCSVESSAALSFDRDANAWQTREDLFHHDVYILKDSDTQSGQMSLFRVGDETRLAECKQNVTGLNCDSGNVTFRYAGLESRFVLTDTSKFETLGSASTPHVSIGSCQLING